MADGHRRGVRRRRPVARRRPSRPSPGIDGNDPTRVGGLVPGRQQDPVRRGPRRLDRLDAVLIAERRNRADSLFATSGQVAGAVAALALAIVLVGAMLFVALRRWVTDPLEQLSVEVRRGGLRRARAPGRARRPAEMVSLADDIDAMRIRILDELARLQARHRRRRAPGRRPGPLQRRPRAVRLRRLARPAGAAAQGRRLLPAPRSAATAASSTSGPTSTSTTPSTAPSACSS